MLPASRGWKPLPAKPPPTGEPKTPTVDAAGAPNGLKSLKTRREPLGPAVLLLPNEGLELEPPRNEVEAVGPDETEVTAVTPVEAPGRAGSAGR